MATGRCIGQLETTQSIVRMGRQGGGGLVPSRDGHRRWYEAPPTLLVNRHAAKAAGHYARITYIPSHHPAKVQAQLVWPDPVKSLTVPVTTRSARLQVYEQVSTSRDGSLAVSSRKSFSTSSMFTTRDLVQR